MLNPSAAQLSAPSDAGAPGAPSPKSTPKRRSLQRIQLPISVPSLGVPLPVPTLKRRGNHVHIVLHQLCTEASLIHKNFRPECIAYALLWQTEDGVGLGRKYSAHSAEYLQAEGLALLRDFGIIHKVGGGPLYPRTLTLQGDPMNALSLLENFLHARLDSTTARSSISRTGFWRPACRSSPPAPRPTPKLHWRYGGYPNWRKPLLTVRTCANNELQLQLGGNTWLWRASLDAWTGDYVEKTTLTPTERGQPNAIYIRYTPPFPADELKAKWLPTLHEHCMEYVLEGSPADSVLAVLAATPWLVLKSP